MSTHGVSWVDRVIVPFVREPLLWGVLLVIIVHAVAFLAPLMLAAARGSSGAGIFCGLLIVATGFGALSERRSRGYSGALLGILVTTWAASLAAAIVLDRTGVF